MMGYKPLTKGKGGSTYLYTLYTTTQAQPMHHEVMATPLGDSSLLGSPTESRASRIRSFRPSCCSLFRRSSMFSTIYTQESNGLTNAYIDMSM